MATLACKKNLYREDGALLAKAGSSYKVERIIECENPEIWFYQYGSETNYMDCVKNTIAADHFDIID